MRAIYRTSFEIRQGAQGGDLFDLVSEAAWLWLFDRKELGLKERSPIFKGPSTVAPHNFAGGFRVESLNIEAMDVRGWSMVVSHSDSSAPELIWHSDVALYRNEVGQHYFSFSQSLGRQDGGMVPLSRKPGRPRIIRTIVRDYIASSGGLRLFGKPLPLRNTTQDITQFLALLERPQRTHPVVLVSIHQQSGRPLIHTGELADHLSGIAHVVAAADAGVTFELTKRLPRWLTCFDGAVRVYWPGFRRLSQTIDHRLWTVNDLAAPPIGFDSGRFADTVLAAIAEVSVNSTSPNYCSFEKLQSLDRKRVIAQAKDNKDWEALANTYADDCAAKDLRISALELELKIASESLFKEQNLTATYKAALEERKQGGLSSAEEQLPVTHVSEAISRAKDRFGGQLVFALNNRSDPNSPYAFPEEVWSAFEWLSTIYYKAKRKIQGCQDFDASVSATIPGWHYSGHQNESTMKGNEDWYRCTHDGRRLWIPEHLKCGTSRDASEAIRIAFCWDDITEKVIIGFLGQHQRNTKT